MLKSGHWNQNAKSHSPKRQWFTLWNIMFFNVLTISTFFTASSDTILVATWNKIGWHFRRHVKRRRNTRIFSHEKAKKTLFVEFLSLKKNHLTQISNPIHSIVMDVRNHWKSQFTQVILFGSISRIIPEYIFL